MAAEQESQQMSCYRLRALWLVPLVLLPLTAGPTSAGVIFGKRNKKPAPTERVPELLAIVKTDGDESKRAAAAQELRQYDPGQYPMIVPVLIDVLLTDKKPGVRVEAAQSLGKIRPISQQAGMALEQALSNDQSMRVRLQARSSLLQYHWSGYQSGKRDDLISQSKEPPLADEKAPLPVISTTSPPLTPPPSRLAPRPDGSRTTSGYPSPPAPFPAVPVRPTTKEPPLAPAPMPQPTAPVAPVTPAPRPATGGSDTGPELTPP
jgi:hypothetical protein